MTVPVARLSSFYLFYYAALGAFTPYWSLFLTARGMSVTAISVMMGLWYATRVVAPTAWTSLAATSPRPIRLLRIGCVLTLISFAAFLLPLPQPWMYPAMIVFCFFYNAVMPQFESITLTHLGSDSHRYGLIRVWGSLGFIAIVTLFGWLIEGDGTAGRAGLLPWMMLPLFVLLVASAFSNHYARDIGRTGGDASGFWQIVRRPPVLAFFLAAFMEQLSFGPYYTFFSVYMDHHGYRTSTLGLLWTIGVVFEVGVFFTIGRFFRRYDASWMLLIALVSSCLRWAVTAAVPGKPAGDAAGADRARAGLCRVLRRGDADAGDLLPRTPQWPWPGPAVRFLVRCRRRAGRAHRRPIVEDRRGTHGLPRR